MVSHGKFFAHTGFSSRTNMAPIAAADCSRKPHGSSEHREGILGRGLSIVPGQCPGADVKSHGDAFFII